jgi:hypothetical protein
MQFTKDAFATAETANPALRAMSKTLNRRSDNRPYRRSLIEQQYKSSRSRNGAIYEHSTEPVFIEIPHRCVARRC